MPVKPETANVHVIEQELAWLEAAIAARLSAHVEGQTPQGGFAVLPSPPSLDGARGGYAELLHKLHLNTAERLVLALVLAPHLAPELLDPFLLQNQATGRRFSEFGGLTGQAHTGFLPTAETAMFLLAGSERAERIALRPLFAPDHLLIVSGVLVVDHRQGDEPPLSAALRLSRDYLEQVLTGTDYTPSPGHDFPAQHITTPLDFGDLVLDTPTRRQIDMIGRWIRHSHTLMQDWGLARRLKPGYRCLFYGSPGTGKTLTACLLGKQYGLPVYRVDLSRIVSKWIGETEKNLASLFDQAQHRNWILFFDEADSLFGKRTESRSSNDRSANQQIAYLLQRLEDFPGLVILATNQRAHMDEAFTRRFQSSILFPVPDAGARLRLWQDMFCGKGFEVAPDIDFESLAVRHELTGGAIVNVLRHACLLAVERDPPIVQASDIMSGIRHELQKEGHYLSSAPLSG